MAAVEHDRDTLDILLLSIERPRAATFATKVHELVSFLVNIRGATHVSARLEDTVTYHDSCSGLRELGVL